MEVGIGIVITTLVSPLILFKAYILHKQKKDILSSIPENIIKAYTGDKYVK